MNSRLQLTQNGETPLHLAASSAISVANFQEQIASFSTTELTDMALTVNNQGKLAIELVNKYMLNVQRVVVKRKIFDYILLRQHKKLSAEINFQDIVARYNLKSDDILYSRLQLACAIVNKVRKIITRSSTHPQMNDNKQDDSNTLTYKIFVMRKILSAKIQNAILANVVPQRYVVDHLVPDVVKIAVELNQNDCEIINNIIAALYEQEKIGNCAEMAELAAHFTNELDESVYTSVRAVINGDHTVAVMPQTQLTSAVYLDPWAGEVCLSTDYQVRLGTYKIIKINGFDYNVITTFNPHYHEFSGNMGPPYHPGIWNFARNIGTKKIDDYFQKSIFKNLTPQEQYLFLWVIRANLKQALKLDLLCDDELENMPDPKETLVEYFADENKFIALLVCKYKDDLDLLSKAIVTALNNAADINFAYTNGATALYVAAANNLLSIVELLIKQGADISKPRINSAANWRALVKDKINESCSRMETHIKNKVANGSNEQHIAITPREVAVIMGNAAVAAFLQPLAWPSLLGKHSVFANDALQQAETQTVKKIKHELPNVANQ